MRENSGAFWDTRGFCNRATVHTVAFARALRGAAPAGDAGAVGELLVGLLMDTQADCDRRIEALRARSTAVPALQPWITAALLRNRRDWRIVKEGSQTTLLERIELFRAECEALGLGAAWRTESAHQPENIPDFGYEDGLADQLFGGRRPRIPRNPRWLWKSAKPRRIFPALAKAAPTPGALASALNVDPGFAVQQKPGAGPFIRAIDDGAWAHFLQRHLCHVVCEIDSFLRTEWGVPDEAAQFEAALSALCKDLDFFPSWE